MFIIIIVFIYVSIFYNICFYIFKFQFFIYIIMILFSMLSLRSLLSLQSLQSFLSLLSLRSLLSFLSLLSLLSFVIIDDVFNGVCVISIVFLLCLDDSLISLVVIQFMLLRIHILRIIIYSKSIQ